MSLAQRPGISREGMGERGSNSFFRLEIGNLFIWTKKIQIVTCFLDATGFSDSQPSIDRRDLEFLVTFGEQGSNSFFA